MTSPRPATLRVVLVWMALEAVAAAQVRKESGETVLWSWLRASGQPMVAASDWLANSVGDLALGLREQRRLVAENRRLRDGLEASQARLLLLEEDLLMTREASLVPPPALDLASEYITARCTFRNLSLGLMQVSAGRLDGVRHDTAVMGAAGLVGRVIRVDAHSSWVETITHPAAAVAIRSERDGVYGLAAGTGGSGLRVQYVPRQASLLRGTVLHSSGADGVYPPGIPVARVTAIRESEGPFLEVTALPTSDLKTMRVVLLLPQWADTADRDPTP